MTSINYLFIPKYLLQANSGNETSLDPIFGNITKLICQGYSKLPTKLVYCTYIDLKLGMPSSPCLGYPKTLKFDMLFNVTFQKSQKHFKFPLFSPQRVSLIIGTQHTQVGWQGVLKQSVLLARLPRA